MVIANGSVGKDYNENAQAIAGIFNPSENTQKLFLLLSENRTLIMIKMDV